MRQGSIVLRRRLLRDRRGVATLEFAMTLPILAIMLLGSVEFVTYSWAIGRVHDASATVGDLVTRNETMDEARIGQIFEAADLVIEGRQSAGADSSLVVTTTSTLACFCDESETDLCYFALWSHTYSQGAVTAGVTPGSPISHIPSGLAQQENESIVYTATTYEFDPQVNLVMPDSMMTLQDQSFFRPRNSEFVIHSGAQATDTLVDCSNFEDVFGVDRSDMEL